MSESTDLKGKTFTRVVDGHELKANISPASWMYPGYGLQLRVSLADAGGGASGGVAYLNDKAVDGSSPTEEQVMNLFGKVGLCKCSKRGCAHMAFDPATVKSNREGECEPCFMDKLNAVFVMEHEKESKKEAALDAKMKAKGYTHKVVAWVHPLRGDDYQLIMHTMGKPTDAYIKTELKKARSRIDTDYKIIEL